MPAGRPPKQERSAFGARLTQIREIAKLSQRDVSEALGIAQPSYAAWERRSVAIPPEQLRKLALILGCEIEDFFLDEGEDRRKPGPVGRARKTFESVSQLPRPKQKKILDVVDMLIKSEA